MAKNDQKPAIRFQGFTDAWEQRKLGHVFVEYSEKGHPELPALTIIQGGGTVRRDESERSLQYDKASLVNYKMVNAEDFIVHLRSFEGGLEKATTLGIISPAYHTFHGEGTDSRFYYSYFRSKRFIEQDLKPHVYGIRDGRSIDIEGMKTIEIPWTSYTEQQVIGNYIDTMDNLITLHQRKYDKLLSIKKSMLEKMFPRDGSKFPEIRFSGFTDPWEQRKLGEVGKARSGIGFPDAEQGGTEGIPFFKVSDMNLDGNGNEMNHANNYVSAEQIAARRWAPITEVPAVFFAKVGAAVMLNRKRLCRFPFLLDNNTMAYSLDQNVWDADFAKALFETVDLTSLVQVGALPSYNAGDVEAMEIMLPTMAEQEKIGLFFARVDNLITLHQRKLEKLKNIKKSMLEKMFV